MVLFERVMVVSHSVSVHCDHCSISIRPQFVTECRRRSDQQGLGHFGTKFGEARVNRYNQIL